MCYNKGQPLNVCRIKELMNKWWSTQEVKKFREVKQLCMSFCKWLEKLWAGGKGLDHVEIWVHRREAKNPWKKPQIQLQKDCIKLV